MVQLTSSLSKYVPFWFRLNQSSSKRYLRKHNLYKLTLSLYGRSRNCYKLAINKFTKKIYKENEEKKKSKLAFRDLFSQRIYAACKDLDYEYHIFISMLPMLNIELDRKILADLAIWEPRTFKALVELAKAREYEFPQNPLKVVEKPSVITRGML